jgi:hypothetical protein
MKALGVKSHIRLIYAQADRQLVLRLSEAGKCVSHNTCVWLYEKGNPRRSNVFNCGPGDSKRDRWATPIPGEMMSLEELIRAIEAKGFDVTVKPK